MQLIKNNKKYVYIYIYSELEHAGKICKLRPEK